MAALSVERAGEGKKTWNPLLRSVKRWRSRELHATPPEMKMLSTRESSAAASVRSTRSCTTACWKLAIRSIVACEHWPRRSSRVGRSTDLRQARRASAAHAVEHGGLQSRKTEIPRIPSHFDVAKIHRVGIAEAGEFIDHRSAWIT